MAELISLDGLIYIYIEGIDIYVVVSKRILGIFGASGVFFRNFD